MNEDEKDKVIEVLKEALRFYAGEDDDGWWEGNRFMAVNHIGALDPMLAGPYVARQALGLD